jgi:hypothetical protein
MRMTQHWGVFVQPFLHWKRNEYYILWVCICSFRYSPCNVHAPYCLLWSTPLYNIFPHYIIRGTNFEGEKMLNVKCVFWFSLQLSSEAFLNLRRIQRHNSINVFWFPCKSPITLVTFWRNLNFLDNYRKILKMSNFMKIRPVGDEMSHAAGHDETDTHFSKFCERA